MASTILLVIVFILDLIAFGLAVAAEQRRSTATLQPDAGKDHTYCVYDSDISTGLGVGAFLFLMLSQLLIMVASKCFCCGRGLQPGGARAWALILFIFCWLTFLIAEACLLAGSVRNAYHTRYRHLFVDDNASCQMLRKGVFAAGAAFVVFTGILSELYYVSFSKANVDGGVPPPYGRETGVGMGTYK